MLRDLPTKRVAGIGRNADTATRRTARTARIDCICGGGRKGDQVGGQTGWLSTARSLGVPRSHGEVVLQDLAQGGTRAHDVRLDTLKD